MSGFGVFNPIVPLKYGFGVYHTKIPIYPIFYLLKGDYRRKWISMVSSRSMMQGSILGRMLQSSAAIGPTRFPQLTWNTPKGARKGYLSSLRGSKGLPQWFRAVYPKPCIFLKIYAWEFVNTVSKTSLFTTPEPTCNPFPSVSGPDDLRSVPIFAT